MPPSCPQPAGVDWTWTPLTGEGRSFQSPPLALINQPVDFQLPLWLLNWDPTTPTGRPFKNRAVSLWRRDPTTCSLPSLSLLSMGDPFRCLFGSILSGSASWFHLYFWLVHQTTGPITSKPPSSIDWIKVRLRDQLSTSTRILIPEQGLGRNQLTRITGINLDHRGRAKGAWSMAKLTQHCPLTEEDAPSVKVSSMARWTTSFCIMVPHKRTNCLANANQDHFPCSTSNRPQLQSLWLLTWN